MRRLWRLMAGQERSIANARTACRQLSARHVEREEVEVFLSEHLAEHRSRPRTA